MTQLAWGMMGQTPGRPTCRNPHDSGARPRRLLVGLGRGRRDRASSTTRPAPTPAAACGTPPRPAASSGSSRPTARCRSTAACPTRRASTPAGRSRARVADAALQYAVLAGTRRRPSSAAASTACASASSGGYFTAALEDDVAAMLERVRGRVRAREIDITWSQDDNRCDVADLHRRARRVRARARPAARPGALRRDARSPTSRQSRSLPAIDYLRGLREPRGGAAALRGRGGAATTSCSAPRRPARPSGSTAPTRRRA